MATYQYFNQLDCYQKARTAKLWLVQFCRTLPRNEYNMKDNMTRAARSMTRNIAEGFGRHHYKDNIRFIRIARGSAYECLDDLDSCVLEDFCESKSIGTGEELIKSAIYSMNGYIKYLKSRA